MVSRTKRNICDEQFTGITWGHVALSQAIQFGKPIITIPIENHGEQLCNSEKVGKIGAGLMLKPKELKADILLMQFINYLTIQDTKKIN